MEKKMIPDRIILSRKGFDAGLGGHASPIFDNGNMVSIPIPEGPDSPEGPNLCVNFEDIDEDDLLVGPLVESLTRGRVLGSDRAHLDPDLRSAAIKGRPVGWLPSLGHAAGAQTQLANKDVGEGDLFLFFGWFRRVSNVAGKWQYIAGAPDLHVVFGWLQIGEIVPDSIRKLIRGKFTASELADVKDPDDKERKVEAVSPHPV